MSATHFQALKKCNCRKLMDVKAKFVSCSCRYAFHRILWMKKNAHVCVHTYTVCADGCIVNGDNTIWRIKNSLFVPPSGWFLIESMKLSWISKLLQLNQLAWIFIMDHDWIKWSDCSHINDELNTHKTTWHNNNCICVYVSTYLFIYFWTMWFIHL